MSGESSQEMQVEAPTQDDYELRQQVGFVLRKAHQRHVAIFAARIGDLTPPQFAALARLHADGAMPQNQLGVLIAMDAATVKGVIDRLAARGLVELARDDDDRRRVVVSLTPQGRDTVERLIPVARAITAETLSPLTAKESALLMRLLPRIA